MAEIKPGRWRLKDGREVVVLVATGSLGWLTWLTIDNVATVYSAKHFEGAEYLGPAVIGESDTVGYWFRKCEELDQQCKELEAETVETRKLLEKSEERCEELAGQLEQPVKSQWAYVPVIPRAQEAETKLASAQCVIEGLEERVRFLEEQAAGMPEVSDENGVKVFRYKSVTVMVRGEREASVQRRTNESWGSIEEKWEATSGDITSMWYSRNPAEAWCRKQLEPKRRKAGTEDEGSACWVKDKDDTEWKEAVLVHCDFLYENPYVAAMDGWLCGWEECEVHD